VDLLAGRDENDYPVALISNGVNKEEKRTEVVIENRDSPPLKVGGISGTGEVYEVRFLAQPGDRFFFFYGSDATELESPQYDVVAIQWAIKGEVAMLPLDLKEPAANPDYDPDNKAKLSLLEQPWVLWVLIGVVVAVLIRVLFTAAKQVEEVG